MCGIAGVYSKNLISKQMVATMLDAIGYRGPDHQGIAQFSGDSGGYLTVGQARLAVVDLSADANQPFVSHKGRTSLTFNGEFYNFQILKQELMATGYPFRTKSDTEVALAILDLKGAEALNSLWGMFAGAYFKQTDGTVLLFRDRLGQKPLYYYEQGDMLLFASEPKAILAALDHVPDVNPEAMRHYFYLGYIPGDMTAFKGMHQLPAGHAMRLAPDRARKIWQWYEPSQTETVEEENLEALFLDAVKLRMIADVPLAAFLSGGLDSSLVVAAMSQLTNKKVNTFCVKFEGPQVLDEAPYAQMVAKHCQTDHHEIVLGSDNLLEMIPQVVDHFDQPFGDSSAVPMYLVSHYAKKQFTVALSGDGADELFAGYRKYLAESYIKQLGPYFLRKNLWKPLSRLLPTGRGNRLLELNRKIRRLLSGDAPSARERHLRLLHMSPVDGESLMGPVLKPKGFEPVYQSLASRLPGDSNLNDFLKFDQDLVLRDDMFVKVDRMSMKASLEVRSPFIDHRLVCFANRLPAVRKLNQKQGKTVLIERLGHWLPPEILNRPKTGFEMPLGAWLRGHLKSWAASRLFESVDTSQWVDGTSLEKVWRAHQSQKLDCTETLWYHLVFASWLKATYG